MKERTINKYTEIRGIGTILDKPGCVATLLLASQITLSKVSGPSSSAPPSPLTFVLIQGGVTELTRHHF